ncbi:hypothetical protein DPMN_173047 [Dreissena polymorpha]|uniref:Uncharacterized protein n=1 Tax=Dreissena polymorpha TaxID=45954 RepID=A0A9D4E3Y2_DREPO|nr:hypothetical protein DPMN_173047 [Dreissena polymorpha]
MQEVGVESMDRDSGLEKGMSLVLLLDGIKGQVLKEINGRLSKIWCWVVKKNGFFRGGKLRGIFFVFLRVKFKKVLSRQHP